MTNKSTGNSSSKSNNDNKDVNGDVVWLVVFFHVVAGGGDQDGGFFFEFVFYAEVAAHVAQGLFGGGEFFEVVEPGVLAGAAAGVGLAADGADGAVLHSAGEGLVGDEEGHGLAGLPEAAGELVGEEKRVVASFGGEGLDCLAGVLPGKPQLVDVPPAKLEAVAAGLAY